MFWFTIPLIALVLDLWLKDPPHWPHPVRLVGLVLQRMESLARGSRISLRIAGALCTLVMALAAGLLVHLLVSLPVLGWLLALYLSYAGLALGGLLQECRRVTVLLRDKDIPRARAAMAGLVSRDVSELDEDGLRRALAETVSENLNDAFVAPFFYLICLGPAGLWAYKTVSTMDSMWGYKTPQWRELGWAAARTDDVLAFLPARMTALSLLVFARLLGYAGFSWSEVKIVAARTESPNAGWPMSAAALIFQSGMGGPTRYFGSLKAKPWLGPSQNPWTDEKLTGLLRLTIISGLGFSFLALSIIFPIRQFFS
ncbi:adenosylcobinamide-phosphate synthase [Desulfonatronum thiosulfatophilum]|uniref:Cobalamin biosynthesis protein CobD n=1 Tax=Desulfonatronum thiosulfatophilum TaxID=617002 RepID=A0A1G6D3Q0_9BACT|nr:adenosylcobinamide-phosphate synthase CbiB [Desulfonatronum thiosulfatophilum]SDB39792.1 adenosylcobinamide-phosphate synthase [Desulfonatronum thiosulfatophilum]